MVHRHPSLQSAACATLRLISPTVPSMSIKGILIVMLAVAVGACGPPDSHSPTTVTQEPTTFIALTTLRPPSTPSTIQFEPNLCPDLDPSIDDSVIVAGFPIKDGAVFLWRDEQPGATYYWRWSVSQVAVKDSSEGDLARHGKGAIGSTTRTPDTQSSSWRTLAGRSTFVELSLY